MEHRRFRRSLAAGVWLMWLGAPTARAEADGFFLGTGRDGALSVTAPGTVINSFARVTGPLAARDQVLPVDDSAGFSAGALVMVLQTTGVVPVSASGDPVVDVSTDAVGTWELARLVAVSDTSLTLTRGLLHFYAAQVTQVVRIPEYTTVTVASTGSLVAAPWNGATGGVVAFLATRTVSNAGQIHATAAGFRGGTATGDTSGRRGCLAGDEAPPSGAQKGEGIANVRFGAASGGRGNVANGGGGGVCFKSGGGGGGNHGLGGMGGRSEGDTDGSRNVGGLGGARLVYSVVDHLSLGGGGGAGHGEEDSGATGGRGGGLVFIRAARLTGPGRLVANGGPGGLGEGSGGSGGGAGGTLSLRFAGTADCGRVSALGGIGGSSGGDRMGPGGGGGGGRVLFQASAGGTCDVGINRASPGNQQNPWALEGPSHGALAGGEGGVTVLPGGFAPPPPPVVSTPAPGSATNHTRPLISGTSLAGSTVHVVLDGVEQAAVVTGEGAGTWSLPPGVVLADGVHSVAASARWQGVHGDSSPLRSFTVDTRAPETAFAARPGHPNILSPATFSFTSDESPVTYECSLDGAAFTVCANPTTYPSPTLGGHTLAVRARDAAGNTDASAASYSWLQVGGSL